jgi:hypothetical protein
MASRKIEEQKNGFSNSHESDSDIQLDNTPGFKLLRKIRRILLRIWKMKYFDKITVFKKTEFWKHQPKWWLMHALKGMVRNFGYSVGIKLLIELTLRTAKRKNILDTVIRFFGMDTLFFALVWTGHLGIFRLLLCSLRRLRGKEDGYNSAIAGFLSAFWLWVDRSKIRRIQIAWFFFARSIDSFFKNIESNKIIDLEKDSDVQPEEKSRRRVTKLENIWVMTFACILTWFALHAWCYEFDKFPYGVEKAMVVMMRPKPNDWNMFNKITRVDAHLKLNSPLLLSGRKK